MSNIQTPKLCPPSTPTSSTNIPIRSNPPSTLLKNTLVKPTLPNSIPSHPEPSPKIRLNMSSSKIENPATRTHTTSELATKLSRTMEFQLSKATLRKVIVTQSNNSQESET